MAGDVETLQEDVFVEFRFKSAQVTVSIDRVLVSFGEFQQSLVYHCRINLATGKVRQLTKEVVPVHEMLLVTRLVSSSFSS